MHYNWPQDAEGIVSYVKQMAGPPSQLLSSLDQTEMIIKENPLTVVGVFKDLESKDCKDFLRVAVVLHSKYNFTQTLDSSCVPHTKC
ncbi:unnamed protein product [Sphagnum jensenii]|uniref:protein disulfide-isomerase n=1 Tax=Sphagnum jensenii TaxID=128206 RepID=A0ABP1AUX1_9BRYO